MRNTDALCAASIMLVVLAIYSQTLGCGFLEGTFDDWNNITGNKRFYPPGIGNIVLFWTEPQEIFIPLVGTLWSLLAMVFGLNPAAFHAANVIVHAANSAAVFLILRRLVAGRSAALAGALLFAAHPLAVEPVAWVSGMKDLLCALFSLLAVLLHLSGSSSRSLLCFALALLCKPAAVTIPAVIIFLHWSHFRGWISDIVMARGWWFVLSVPVIVLSMHLQPASYDHDFIPGILQRVQVAGHAFGFHLANFLLPWNLHFDYGHTPAAVLAKKLAPWAWIPLLLVFVVSRKVWRPAFVGLCLSFLLLLPTLGFIPFRHQIYSTVADRYAYMALLGGAFVLASAVSRFRGLSVLVAAAAVIIALSVLSFLQAGMWRDTETLMRHSVENNPRGAFSRLLLAEVVAVHGCMAEAFEHVSVAIEVYPNEASLGLMAKLHELAGSTREWYWKDRTQRLSESCKRR